MGRLEGRVAIVTGGGRGIGAVYCTALAAEGAKVVVSDIVDTTGTVDAIKTSGGDAIGVHCDVTSPEEITDMVSATIAAFGKIDILVNNAALFADIRVKSFMEIDEDEWDRMMAINTRGLFSCAKAVVPEMKKNGYGKIVNITSSTVHKGVPMMLHYVSSKGAVIAFTRSLSREVGADGIGVNALAPGLTISEKVGEDPQWAPLRQRNLDTRALKREQTPDDLIGTLIYLCSSDSDFVTGQTVVADGGSAMH